MKDQEIIIIDGIVYTREEYEDWKSHRDDQQ